MNFGSIIHGMVIDMNVKQVHTPVPGQTLPHGKVALEFAVAAQERSCYIARAVQR